MTEFNINPLLNSKTWHTYSVTEGLLLTIMDCHPSLRVLKSSHTETTLRQSYNVSCQLRKLCLEAIQHNPIIGVILLFWANLLVGMAAGILSDYKCCGSGQTIGLINI